ncbi:hypothetical protein PTTG_25308 [Puccinia triticina 1-1 BBBD Race 1]|uniref:Uncharacterized protein n=1 Tax=Puccinia triticina (isolate 1-1 / race 1 (BBBD)) TaxID=630390 RepID=A0A180H5N3_PUCT1|nr:hypothetical protein PTTG_25308 [Puccinia triticina 1-1 BBBD Race 1]
MPPDPAPPSPPDRSHPQSSPPASNPAATRHIFFPQPLPPPSNCLPIRPTVCAAKKRTAYKKDSVAIQLPFDRPFPPPESAQPIKKILYLISFMFTSRPSGAP